MSRNPVRCRHHWWQKSWAWIADCSEDADSVYMSSEDHGRCCIVLRAGKTRQVVLVIPRWIHRDQDDGKYTDWCMIGD